MLITTGVHAAAFNVSEIGAPGSLGTAGVANTTNTFGTDSAYTNPAAMTGLNRDSVVGGMQMLIPDIKFDSSIAEAGGKDGGNAGNIAAIPSLFAVKVLDDRTRMGFSVTGPLGGGMDFGDDFVGRYGAQKVELTGLALSPSMGYRVTDRLSLGVGVSALYANFEETIGNNFGPTLIRNMPVTMQAAKSGNRKSMDNNSLSSTRPMPTAINTISMVRNMLS